jgi:lipopolysaccharide transport system permease protein
MFGFNEIFKYRDLFAMLVVRDIRIRYKQAAMGFMWAIFMPVVAILAGILIKTAMSIVSGKGLDLAGAEAVAVKVLPWTFFVSSIKFSVQSLVGNRELVTKIYFPREVLTFASVAACFFDFFVASMALTVILAFTGIGISVHLVWLPLVIILLILYTAGVGLILAAANLFYRDVKYVVEIILMFGIFFTPVFYEAATFGKWKTLLLMNPIGSILEITNSIVVLHQAPETLWLVYAGISSVLIFILGLTMFNKSEPYFAERI